MVRLKLPFSRQKPWAGQQYNFPRSEPAGVKGCVLYPTSPVGQIMPRSSHFRTAEGLLVKREEKSSKVEPVTWKQAFEVCSTG